MLALSRARSAAAAIAVCGLVFPSVASAAVWSEIDDATRLPPGQQTVGDGVLTQIIGRLTGGLRGIQTDFQDMFCINITDPAAFSATTVGGPVFDTQLWLFRHDGTGIVFNDNVSSTSVQSRISNENLQWFTQPGRYSLAISGFDNDPVTGIDTPLWNDGPRDTQRAPDGPGAQNPIVAWATGDVPPDAFGEYVITLTGAEFCIIPSAPTAGLLAAASLLTLRRRR